MLPAMREQKPATDSGKSGARPGSGRRNSRRAANHAERSRAAAPPDKNRTRTGPPRVLRLNDLTPAHLCRPSHDLPALLSSNDCLGERVQRNVLGEKLFEGGPKDKNTGSFERIFIEGQGQFQAAGESDWSRCFHTADYRPALDFLQALDLPHGLAVSCTAVPPQNLTQSGRVLLFGRLNATKTMKR